MRRLNFGSCCISLTSACVLGILAIILFVVYAYNQSKPVVQHEEEQPIQTHLNSQEKEIALRIGLIADTENEWGNTENALERLKKEKIDTVFHLGDVTQFGVDEDLDIAKSILDDSGLKYAVVPGDRDLYASKETIRAFNAIFEKSYQVVSIGENRFLLIDNANESTGIDQEQWALIEKEIANADFVLLHNPIIFDDSFFVGRKGMGQYSKDVETQRQRLLELIRMNSVRAVFAGDQHRFAEIADTSKPDLYQYVIGSLRSDRNLDAPNFAILTIYTDGDYSVQKVTL